MATKVTFDPAAKIAVVVKANPYKANSVAWNTYEYFSQCATVADFRAVTAGNPMVDPGYLRYSSRDGYITVTPNPYGANMKPAKHVTSPNYAAPVRSSAGSLKEIISIGVKAGRVALTKAQFEKLGQQVAAKAKVRSDIKAAADKRFVKAATQRHAGRRTADKMIGQFVTAVVVAPIEQVL